MKQHEQLDRSDTAATVGAEPKRKRKRKRTKKAEKGHTKATERPAFARKYPPSKELERLVEAFELGNFALVRRRAPQLADESEDPAVQAAALDLRRRLDPAPTAIYLWALGVALAV